MKSRILVVDDDLAVLLTLKAVLQLNRFSVHTATSAQEAITKLTANRYDLVISDVRMSSAREGLEVIRAAKAQPYHPAIAILTADPPADFNWKTSGVHQLLVKPVGTEELLRQIQFLVSRRQNAQVLPIERAHSGVQNSSGSERRRKAV